MAEQQNSEQLTEVFVSLGSNIEPARHLQRGIDLLGQQFGPLHLSTVYASKAVGFEGDDFLNAVASFRSYLPVEIVVNELHRIETACGRSRSDQKFAARTLDIDLLLYGDLIQHEDGMNLPRDEITQYAFVLKPLAELIPDRKHPETGETYADIWNQFNASTQPLTPVELPTE